jgi:hypothetical protein
VFFPKGMLYVRGICEIRSCLCAILSINTGYLCAMRQLLFILFAAIPLGSYAQLTIDSTRTTLTIRDKSQGGNRTLSIYRSFVPGAGVRHQAVYQPIAGEFGEEPEILKLKFAEEAVHLKRMLDAALAKRTLNLSKLSINILPYADLTGKLIDVYSQSPEWNDYLKKTANLKRTVTLFDGSEISEVAYNTKMAEWVLNKSDFLKEIQAFFTPYGYAVANGGFSEEHQEILSLDKLMILGKDRNTFIPVPNPFFMLTKFTK